jgi:hypothetical protein
MQDGLASLALACYNSRRKNILHIPCNGVSALGSTRHSSYPPTTQRSNYTTSCQLQLAWCQLQNVAVAGSAVARSVGAPIITRTHCHSIHLTTMCTPSHTMLTPTKIQYRT